MMHQCFQTWIINYKSQMQYFTADYILKSTVEFQAFYGVFLFSTMPLVSIDSQMV